MVLVILYWSPDIILAALSIFVLCPLKFNCPGWFLCISSFSKQWAHGTLLGFALPAPRLVSWVNTGLTSLFISSPVHSPWMSKAQSWKLLFYYLPHTHTPAFSVVIDPGRSISLVTITHLDQKWKHLIPFLNPQNV